MESQCGSTTHHACAQIHALAEQSPVRYCVGVVALFRVTIVEIVLGSLLTGCRCRDSVGVSPSDLVPKNAKDTRFQLKKVDCALFLTPPPPFCAKIERKLMALADSDQNINQTSAGFIKKLPLIASFKLKRQAGTDPLVQLGIWSAALAERLGKLQGSGEKESGLMAIPVVTVVGHDWKVYYSYTAEDGQRVSF